MCVLQSHLVDGCTLWKSSTDRTGNQQPGGNKKKDVIIIIGVRIIIINPRKMVIMRR